MSEATITNPNTLKTADLQKNKRLRHAISTPFIWGLAIPVSILHLFVFIYQAVAFRLYGIKRVRLRDFVNFDREKLSYLSLGDKFNCAYCSYVNGFLAYASEIGHRTEFYWCGVKHCNQPANPAFAYQSKFAAYGSEEEYCQILLDSGRRVHKHSDKQA
jgi:hypothetical protein